jgi:hypothetical protein
MCCSEHLPFICPEFATLTGSLSLTSLYRRFVKAHTRLVSFVKPDKKYFPHHQNLPLHVLLTPLTLHQPYRRCFCSYFVPYLTNLKPLTDLYLLMQKNPSGQAILAMLSESKRVGENHCRSTDGCSFHDILDEARLW